MEYVSYNLPIRHKTKKTPNLHKLAVLLFVLSLFFIKQGGTIPSVVASELAAAPPIKLSSLNNFLRVKDNSPLPPVYSKSYLLMDVGTGEVLISKNENLSVPVASTTKIVTALVAKNLFELNDVVTVKKLAATINGSEIKLELGERITVRDLLKGLLIQSGNDTAFALAEHYSNEEGDYKSFVNIMNEYVLGIGLKNTVFGDPAGLDDVIGRSTAWDLAHVSRLLLQDPVLAEMVTIPKTTIASVDGKYVHELKSSNRLLLSDSSYYLPGAIGIKTGFTPEAGHCLVSAYKFSGETLVGVVLNTNEYSIMASAFESKKLYEWANRYVEKVNY